MADDWKQWTGGKCPVRAGTTVELKHRDGSTGTRTIEWPGWWEHLGTPCDIVAYRIVRDAPNT
jgi:hypothetical protein